MLLTIHESTDGAYGIAVIINTSAITLKHSMCVRRNYFRLGDPHLLSAALSPRLAARTSPYSSCFFVFFLVRVCVRFISLFMLASSSSEAVVVLRCQDCTSVEAALSSIHKQVSR